MRKTMIVPSILTALALSSLAGPRAVAAVVDPASTGTVMIDVVAAVGCPDESVMTAVSADNTSFRVWFGNFYVHIGPYARPTEARLTCQVSLRIHVPAGNAYAIDEVEYGGYALLARGALFTQRARHYRTGQAPAQPFRSHSWTGPREDEWQSVDTFPAEELFFPPCGTNPEFHTVLGLRLDAGTSDPTIQTSFAALDSVDGPYGAIYHLQTRPC